MTVSTKCINFLIVSPLLTCQQGEAMNKGYRSRGIPCRTTRPLAEEHPGSPLPAAAIHAGCGRLVQGPRSLFSPRASQRYQDLATLTAPPCPSLSVLYTRPPPSQVLSSPRTSPVSMRFCGLFKFLFPSFNPPYV